MRDWGEQGGQRQGEGWRDWGEQGGQRQEEGCERLGRARRTETRRGM